MKETTPVSALKVAFCAEIFNLIIRELCLILFQEWSLLKSEDKLGQTS